MKLISVKQMSDLNVAFVGCIPLIVYPGCSVSCLFAEIGGLHSFAW
jgi:hypothetical protein